MTGTGYQRPHIFTHDCHSVRRTASGLPRSKSQQRSALQRVSIDTHALPIRDEPDRLVRLTATLRGCPSMTGEETCGVASLAPL